MATKENISSRYNQKIAKYRKYPQIIKYVVSGTISGLVSRLVAAPFERVVLLRMVNEIGPYTNSKGFNSIFHEMLNIFKKEGIYGIFKGNLVNLIRWTPCIAIEFYCFDQFKSILNSITWNPLTKSANNLFAGGLAGMVAYTIVYPIDFIRMMIVVNHIPPTVPFHQLAYFLYKKHGFLNFIW